MQTKNNFQCRNCRCENIEWNLQRDMIAERTFLIPPRWDLLSFWEMEVFFSIIPIAILATEKFDAMFETFIAKVFKCPNLLPPNLNKFPKLFFPAFCAYRKKNSNWWNKLTGKLPSGYINVSKNESKKFSVVQTEIK